MNDDLSEVLAYIRALPKSTGKWRELENDHLWLDHLVLGDDDVPRLAGARWLTLWNVKVPQDFYQRLPNVRELEIDGGTWRDLVPIRKATQLTRLVINQVRQVTDLSWIADLSNLESLALFGVPQIESMPSLAGMGKLRFVQVGQMRRLRDLTGVAEAPALEELRFTQRLGVTAESMKPFVGHPTLARFGWAWDEGVSAAQARSVLDALPLPRPDWST